MSSKLFKLSAVAGCILAATQANAALYRVVEVDTSSLTSAQEYYASGISATSADSAEASAITGSETQSCFSTACSETNFTLAGDTLNGAEGFSFKTEVPLNYDNYFYLQDQDDLTSYCDGQLKYSTCDYWASERWSGSSIDGTVYGGLQSEREAFSQSNYLANSAAFSDSGSFSFTPVLDSSAPDSIGTMLSDTAEQVVNRLDENGWLIGNTSSGFYNYGGNYVQVYRQRGFFYNGTDTVVLLPEFESVTQSYETSSVAGTSAQEQIVVEQMGRTMAYDSFTYNGSTYIVGSAAVAPFDYTDGDKDYSSRDVTSCVGTDDPALLAACQNFAFAQKAYVWNTTNPDLDANRFPVADWATSYANYNEGTAQASVRAAAIVDRSDSSYNSLPVLAGFNTQRDDTDMMMQAAVFLPASTTSFSVGENAWESKFIANATLEIGGTPTYSNSLAKDINQNLIVIGEAKRLGSVPENGAAANRMFVADANLETPTANYFSGGIFFSGAGGEVNAINNYNEIVGSIDAESHREIGGKSRKRRAFIYPYSGTGSVDARREVFANQAWWLDDLTNGGSYSAANNKYRIFTASDINDAGVISATAFKCASGYDSTSHFAYCGGGSEQEQVVAVKLIPLSSDTAIVPRTEETSTVSREGAGMGWLSLGFLALLGFRRRK